MKHHVKTLCYKSDSSFDACEPETSRSLGVPILLAVVVSREGEAPPHAVQNILPGVRSMEPMGWEVEFWRVGQAFVEVLSKFDFEKWTLSDEEPDKCWTF